jgi:hypothetical protein
MLFVICAVIATVLLQDVLSTAGMHMRGSMLWTLLRGLLLFLSTN